MNSPQPKKVVFKRRNYSKGIEAEQMKDAYEEAQNQDSPNITLIAKKHNVSRKAPEFRIKGEISLFGSPGKKPLLSVEEEQFLVNFLIEMSALGFGYSLNSMKKLLNSIMGKETSTFTSGWVNHFLSKYPEITLRKTEAIDRLKLRSVEEDLISFYFMTLELAFLRCQQLSGGVSLTPVRIFAMDETGFYPNLKENYVIAKKGTRGVYSITSEVREHLTVVAYASAEGFSGHPFFILPRNIPNFLGSNFSGSKFGVSSTGYINETLFEEWCQFFVEDFRHLRQAPHLWCLLVLDSLHCHTLNPKALQILNSANILAVSLPSHTSAFLQVHDLSIFAPLKKYFKSGMSQFVKEKGPQTKLNHLPQILEEPWVLANNSLNIQKGFKKAGIWPLNTAWVQENIEKIPFFRKKDKELQLQELIQSRIENNEIKNIMSMMGYLDLASDFKDSRERQRNTPPQLKRTLSNILLETKANIEASNHRKTAPKKNMIGEFFDDAKILNEQERINFLTKKIQERNEKKQKKWSKDESSQSLKKTQNKRKYEDISQSQGTSVQQMDYKKIKLTQ